MINLVDETKHKVNSIGSAISRIIYSKENYLFIETLCFPDHICNFSVVLINDIAQTQSEQ